MSLQTDLSKYIPRKEQIECIQFIKANHERSSDTKFYLLDLPVGVGKSHLALMIADFYNGAVDNTARIDIITNTKILQDQYCSTYDSINDLKGKENYECAEYGSSCSEGSEFNRLRKVKCESCPHSMARDRYLGGRISLTNFYLYIMYSLYVPDLLQNRASKVLIVDECHELEEVLSNFISVKITENILKRFDLSEENKILKIFSNVNSLSTYLQFLNQILVEVDLEITDIETALLARDKHAIRRSFKIKKILKNQTTDQAFIKSLNELKQFKTKISIFFEEYEKNPSNWVLETSWNEKTKKRDMSLEPIWASEYLEKYIYSRYDKVFLMSGTIINKNMFCEVNGIDADKAVYYSIDSPFEIEKRPIYYMPIGKMSYNKKEETFENYKTYLPKILSKYKDKKGIIHTNSFELASWIRRDIHDKRLKYHDSMNKDEVLKEHRTTTEASVIVSPSMDTGVSFDDELARFQIITKIPYPSLASQKNKMRQQMRPEWYSWKTVTGLIQMSGRSVRSKDDWADTIIIDGSFGDVMKWSSHFIPRWFSVAIKRVKVKLI